MTKLQQLIKELCPNGVEYKSIEQLCEVFTGGEAPSDCIKGAPPDDIHKYPVYSNGTNDNAIYGYSANYVIDKRAVTFSSIGTIGHPTIRDAKFTPIIRLKVIIPKDDTVLNVGFLRYVLEVVEFAQNKSSVPNINAKMIKSIEIPIPPLPVQEEIVRILDELTEKTDKLIFELNTELEARKKQYEHYKNKLMSVDSANIFKLGDIAFICDGTHQTPHYTDSGVKFISVENINDILNTTKYISKEDYDKYKVKPQIGDVFMTRIGSIGKCAVLDKEEDLAYYVTLALIRPNQNIVISKYLKYVIESMVGAKELRKRTLLNAVPIKINKDDIGKIELPIPSINSQEKIVSQIEKYDIEFDMLIRSISNEIENRKKQYEYYRDNLLTF